MANVFSITASATSLRTDAKGQAEVSFTATNTSGRPIKARAEAKASDPAQQAWLTVVGETERDFPVDGTHQFSVKVTVPPGNPAGQHSLRLDVVSTANPDDDFEEGPTISLEVGASAPVKRKFPWWIAAAAAVVLAIGGVTAYLLLRSDPEPAVEQVAVPDVVGEPSDTAGKILQAAGLKLGDTLFRPVADSKQSGIVQEQAPAAGSTLPKESSVNVHLGVAVKAPASLPWSGRNWSYDGVTLNGQGNIAKVASGEPVSIAFNWSSKVDQGNIYCPTCVVQVYYGVKGEFSNCFVQRGMFTPGSKQSKKVNGKFNAPKSPGVYYITQSLTLDFSCKPDKNRHNDDPNNAIAALIVE